VRILLIGGSGFVGPHVAADLLRRGHDVTIFHRGRTPFDSLVPRPPEIIGDRTRLADFADDLRASQPDVVVDLILSSGRQVHTLMTLFRGVVRRVVALSSCDVYRACVSCMVPNPARWSPCPSPRTPRSGRRSKHIRRIACACCNRCSAGSTKNTTRFPLSEQSWGIRSSLARSCAAGRIYNVGEAESLSELNWARQIASVAGWPGEFIVLPADRTPSHLHMQGNLEQHWLVDTTRIREELGYVEPVPRREALARTVEWERAHPPSIDPRAFDYEAEDAAIAARTA